MPARTKPRQPPRATFGLALVAACAVSSCGSRARTEQHRAPVVSGARTPRGLFWARLGEVADGMRVQVWLDSDGTRVRGAYTAMPWNAEIEGRVLDQDRVQLTFLERGITRSVGTRTREATLRWDARGMVLAGEDAQHERIELARVGYGDTTLRPGAWLGRWTGLPFGMAVETRITDLPDGRVRAVYQYQSSGGVRDGSFEGTREPNGVLHIRWMEVTESGLVARGTGRLSPGPFGLRGTYAIDGAGEETGEWVLEPFDP